MADSLETHHPFLIRDAPGLGIRPSDLRSPRYRRIFRGVGMAERRLVRQVLAFGEEGVLWDETRGTCPLVEVSRR